ncbi:hypothetical protein [Streptomyces chilikensis]|uniref:Uncharacterized protein n=1 Tax=Streptomyces chilikensis TaxID=1194079 RepID=A0ABV3EMJ2_9ACTN
MSDVYAVDLALDLAPSVPTAVLDDLRFHLGAQEAENDVDEDTDAEGRAGDLTPLLSGRGPARRIGGVRTGELLREGDGWALTARQELHAELLPELDSLVERLVYHARTEGVVGRVRFHEDEAPELLLKRGGTLVRMPLVPRP